MTAFQKDKSNPVIQPFLKKYINKTLYILEKITLPFILLIHCKLHATAVISFQFIKKIQMY